jgi:hypothetical protein
MFVGKGKIKYDDSDGFRITLEIVQDLIDYYRSLIPLYYRPIKSGWLAHITILNPQNETLLKTRHWEDHVGEEIEFLYDSYVLEGNGYFWINAWSKRLEVIRDELGLPNVTKCIPRPEGYNKTFHITIGKYQELFDFKSGPEI